MNGIYVINVFLIFISFFLFFFVFRFIVGLDLRKLLILINVCCIGCKVFWYSLIFCLVIWFCFFRLKFVLFSLL